MQVTSDLSDSKMDSSLLFQCFVQSILKFTETLYGNDSPMLFGRHGQKMIIPEAPLSALPGTPGPSSQIFRCNLVIRICEAPFCIRGCIGFLPRCRKLGIIGTSDCVPSPSALAQDA